MNAQSREFPMRTNLESFAWCVAFWLMNAAVVLALLPVDVLLPARQYYVAYLLPPSVAGYLAIAVSVARSPRWWPMAGGAGVCSSLAVIWLQGRLLLALALDQDPLSRMGGLLSNAFVTAHSWFGTLLVTLTLGSLVLAATAAKAARSAANSTPRDTSTR
jgi:hypothetical protein